MGLLRVIGGQFVTLLTHSSLRARGMW